MDRFKPLDVTNSSIGTVLFHDEEVISIQVGVGLYDGKDKALHQASGTIYLTSHRLIYVDDALPHRYSCYLELNYVKATEYYAGFLKSSPKVTLFLAEVRPGTSSTSAGSATSTPNTNGADPSISNDGRDATLSSKQTRSGDWRSSVRGAFDAGADSSQLLQPWICRICGFSNKPPSAVPGSSSSSLAAASAAAQQCELCGVARDPASEPPTSRNSPSSYPYSSSAPRSSSSFALDDATRSNSRTPAGDSVSSLVAAPPDEPASKSGVACPTCTFLNHPSMLRCEICGSALGTDFPQAEVKRKGQSAQPDQPISRQSLEDRNISASKSSSSLRESGAGAYPWSQSRVNTSGTSLSKNGNGESSGADHVKLSFRKGGDRECYALIKSTLKSKAWASTNNQLASRPLVAAPSDIDGRSVAIRKAGIDGILNATDSSNRAQTEGMVDALKDLEALMQKAKQMVDLAETLNSKLAKQESQKQQIGTSVEGQVVTESSEAATLIRSSLVRLGLPAPAVTEDMAKDEMEYHVELARELAQILLGSGDRSRPQSQGLMGRGTVLRKGQTAAPQYLASDLEHGRGLISLDEAWCVWNRARGIALVPPRTLRTVATFLSKVTSPPIAFRQFRSGLCVLHTPHFSERVFEARLLKALTQRDPEAMDDESALWGFGKTSVDIARVEDAPILLVTEMIETIEMTSGSIARDDGAKGGTRWYPNMFKST